MNGTGFGDHRAPAIRWCGIALAGLLTLSGCGKASKPELAHFEGRRAYAEVEALVKISPRDAGTPKARKAAEFILNRLKELGIKSEIDTFSDETPEGVKTFHNVIGRIPGKTDQWIILGSHFDTMPGIAGFQGANDGGSSTGILLELGRILSGKKPTCGIILAFFDGEEGIAHYIPGDGLHGSRHFARQLKEGGQVKDIKGMILLDMVGDSDLHIIIPANSSQVLAKAVIESAHATGYRDHFSLARESIITDDHVPFLQIGIPAIDLIDFKYGSAPAKNDYWHTEQDNMQHISAESLEVTGTVVLDMIKMMVF